MCIRLERFAEFIDDLTFFIVSLFSYWKRIAMCKFLCCGDIDSVLIHNFLNLVVREWGRDSSVNIVTSLRAGRSGFRFLAEAIGLWPFQKRAVWLLGPPSLVFIVYLGMGGGGCHSRGFNGPVVKLTTHLYLLMRLRISGATPPFLSMHRDNCICRGEPRSSSL